MEKPKAGVVDAEIFRQASFKAVRTCLELKVERLLLAGLAHVADVGEEVVVLGLGHGLPELRRVLKHADQDLQAVQVRVLRGDDLKNGLTKKGGGVGGQVGGKVRIKRPESGTFQVCLLQL